MKTQAMNESRRCGYCNIPINLHAQCWNCGALVGPGHEEDILVLGLCGSCRRLLGRIDSEELFFDTEQVLQGETIDTTAASVILKVSSKTVRKLVATGRLRATELPRYSDCPTGKRYRFNRADVEKLLSNS